MRKISKALAVGAVALALGGAGVAVAQGVGPGNGPGGGFGPMGYGPPGIMHGRGGPGMMGGWGGGPGYGDPAEHLARLKTELGIRPEQNAAWDAYVKAVRDSAEQMRSAHNSVDFDTLRAMSWKDMQAYMGAMHDRQAAAFKTEEAAATKLLASLDDGQKTKALLPVLLHTGFGPGFHGGPGMMGPGFGHGSWGRPG
jgi:hypothetical protein